MKQIMRFLCLVPIRFYQYVISPLLPPACRFQPTCSHYTREAIARHGVMAGLFLGLRRILCCHPWHKECGYDPVPESFTWSIDPRAWVGYKRRITKN